MNDELGVRMTFVEHLDELRTRLLRSLIYLSVGFLGGMFFYEELVDIVTVPHFQAMSWLAKPPSIEKFIAASYSGSIMAVMKLACIAGLLVTSPLIGREIWRFVAAGLYKHERRYVESFAPISYLLFLLGCVFGYFIMIPYALYGMACMLPLDKVEPIFSFGEYLNLFLTLTVLLGAVFQLPVIMVFLAKIGVATPETYRRGRKIAVVANVIVSAVLSPPDLMSMIFFILPILLLYEIGVLFSRWASPAILPST